MKLFHKIPLFLNDGFPKNDLIVIYVKTTSALKDMTGLCYTDALFNEQYSPTGISVRDNMVIFK